jgi:hypothetical protein
MTASTGSDSEREPTRTQTPAATDAETTELDEANEAVENEALAEHDIPAMPDAVPTDGAAGLP